MMKFQSCFANQGPTTLETEAARITKAVRNTRDKHGLAVAQITMGILTERMAKNVEKMLKEKISKLL